MSRTPMGFRWTRHPYYPGGWLMEFYLLKNPPYHRGETFVWRKSPVSPDTAQMLEDLGLIP